jgi:5,5'-dehydrodivanillate O-demethylase oxygenase subunit
MLTKEQNERLSRVGRGTPTGELMRRYWHPIAASSQLKGPGTRPIRLLGEDLVLYRDKSGTLGLVGERCPHRRAGMVFGIPEQEGLRCAYHGWRFAADGRCLEQPYEQTEDSNSTFKDRVTIQAYEVQELGGMIFAYLGPKPAPMIPRWDLFVMECPKEIGWAVIPCNWLQISENSLDPVHVEWLHQYFCNYVMDHLGRPEEINEPTHHRLVAFDESEHGIVKRRLCDDETEEVDEWAVGHPHVFPNILKSGSTAHPVFQIRVPMDDTHTTYYWYSCHLPRPGLMLPELDEIPFFEAPVAGLDDRGQLQWDLLDNNSGQDMVMWYTQGEITDREEEHLGLSDKGVIMFRKQLEDNIRKVERGEDPMNVFRDPATNKFLSLAVEDKKLGGSGLLQAGKRRGGHTAKYSPLFKAMEESMAGKQG